MNTSSRLVYALVGLRWIALAIGAAAYDPKHPHFLIAGAVVYEAIMSFLQIKTRQTGGTGLLLVCFDLGVGVFLAYAFGPAFIMLSTVVPILEAFSLSNWIGLWITLVDFVGVLMFVAPRQRLLAALPVVAAGDFTRFIILQILASILAAWFFFAAQKTETETAGKSDERETRPGASSQNEARSKEMESLYREILSSHGELEQLRGKTQAALEAAREESEAKTAAALQREEQAVRRLNDLIPEIEQSQKERDNLNFLVETSGELHQSLHLEETFVKVVETVEKVLPSQTSVLFLTEEEKGGTKLYAQVAASPYSDYFRNYGVKLGDGIVGRVFQSGEPAIIENGSLHTADGHEFETLLSSEKSALAAPLKTKDGSPLGVIYLGRAESRAFSWQDMNVLLRFIPHIQTAIAKALEYHEAVSEGVIDPASGLHNRFYFEERLSEEIKRAYRYQLSHSLILLAIDRFSSLSLGWNEKTAHALLAEMAELLREYVRDVDVLARVGEGKFAIILVQAEKSNAVAIADRIRTSIALRAFGGEVGEKIQLTASVGVAGYPKDASYKGDLMAKCEAALADAVAKGGNKTSDLSPN